MRLFAKFCLVFVLLVGCSGLAKADPIRINSGSTAQLILTSGSFNLTDANGSIYVGSIIGNTRIPAYLPGSIFNPTINLFQTFGQQDFRGIYNNGTWYPAVYFPFNSSLTFTSSDFQLPNLNGSTFSTTIPFTMQGVLVPVGECVGDFSICNVKLGNNAINGSGTVTYTFDSSGVFPEQKDKWQLTRANYSFTTPTPEPTPEPTTLLLFGTGLAGVIGYARRRRKSNLTK